MTYRLSLEQPAITTLRAEVTSSKRALGHGRDHTCGRQPGGKFHGGTFGTKHQTYTRAYLEPQKDRIRRIIHQLACTVQVEFPGLAPVQPAPCFIGPITLTREVPVTRSDSPSTAFHGLVYCYKCGILIAARTTPFLHHRTVREGTLTGF